MMTKEPKTQVKVNISTEDKPIDILKNTIRALRISGKEKASQKFQQEVTSGNKELMEVVKEWVIIVD